MRPAWRAAVPLALALALPLALAAQSATAAGLEQRVNEFWPELNAFVSLDERSRIFLSASFARGREYASATEASWGVHYDRFARPLPDWWTRAVPMMEAGWNLAFRVGYNRIAALDGAGADENRLLGDVTLRSVPLYWGLQLADRSRLELRDVDGARSWRYRNRARIERGFGPAELFGASLGGPLAALGVAGITPYAMLEWTWDSRVSDWNRRYQQYGVEVELRGRLGAELYVGIQDQSRAASSAVVAVGAVLVVRY
ncbi:MAG: hypothetical protein EHM87_07255 [Burkholderiales bacterium]|nr:MAG: hypothetical protein EHM87_07255 [Burkholderiales bacterium]